MRKGYLIPQVIIILAFIMFFVALVLYLNSDLIKKAKNTPTPIPSPIVQEQQTASPTPAETANWKAYTNKKWGLH